MRLGPVEIVVPDVRHRHHHRQVLGEGRGAEVLVHGVEAGEEAAPVVWAERDDIGEADRRIDGVASTDPVPEAERVLGVDPELGDLLEVGRDRHEVATDGVGTGLVGTVDDVCGLQRVDQPVLGHPGVGHRLQGGERLGRHDEQHGFRIEVVGLLEHVGGIDVADEPALDAVLLVRFQGLVDHHRAQIGAADADVDDGGEGLPVTPPTHRCAPIGERIHAVEHLDLDDDVGPSTSSDDLRAAAGPCAAPTGSRWC